MKEPVVSAQGVDRSATEQADSASGWKNLFIVGIAVGTVGLIDIAMMFPNAQWASLDWEFATLSGIIEGMPLMTLGIGLMCAAAVANGWVLTRRLMAILTMLMTLLVAVVTLMFVLDTFAALQAVQPAQKNPIRMLAIKTCLMGMTYFALYLALGVWTWRRMRATKGSRG